jgi:hypothetical protein
LPLVEASFASCRRGSRLPVLEEKTAGKEQ